MHNDFPLDGLKSNNYISTTQNVQGGFLRLRRLCMTSYKLKVSGKKQQEDLEPHRSPEKPVRINENI